jgi:MFS family permease
LREEQAVASAEPRGITRFRALAALRHSSYRLLMISIAPGMIAMQMGMVAFGYLAFTLSGSATALGFIGLGWGVPMLALSLVGGVVADRFPRRTILLGTQSLMGAAALLGAILLLTGVIQVWHIFIIALLQGTSFAFNMPARQAMIADLVGPEDLGNAIALNNSLLNLTRVIGPPIAGALIGMETIGINGVFIIMALAPIAVLLALVRLPASAPAKRPRRSGWIDLTDGLRYIMRSPVLLSLLALAFAPVLFGMPYQTLLPVFALDMLNAGPEGLGALGMANGLGALAGSLGIAALADSPHRRLVQKGLGLAFGLGLIGFANSPNLPLAALSLALTGACSAGYMSVNSTLVMQATPREMHGRIMSVYMMTFSLMPLASLPVARLADVIGAPAIVSILGILLMLSILTIAVWQRRAAIDEEPAVGVAD